MKGGHFVETHFVGTRLTFLQNEKQKSMKSRYYFLLPLLTLLPYCAGAQYGNVWTFSDSSGLDFSTVPPRPVSSAVTGWEASATMCDAQGNLLFYTNGLAIWDRNHNLMPNGNTLVSLPPPANGHVTQSSSQGALIVPAPGQSNKYYIFSLTNGELNANMGRLYYCVVDMELNNGLGDVVPSQKEVFVASGFTEHMSGISANRCNVWIVTISQNTHQLNAFEVTESGVNPIPVQSDLLPANQYNIYFGRITFSPDGQKLLVARGGMGLYHFDRETGQATSWLTLARIGLSGYYYVGDFSLDNTKAYIMESFGSGNIFQFDLGLTNDADILNSRTHIAAAVNGALKLAPDGKIYVRGGEGNSRNISVIEFPNLAGTACQFTRNSIELLPSTRGSALCLPNATIPVIYKDTFITSRRQSGDCYTDEPVVLNHTVPGSWGIHWEDGSTDSTRSITEEGIYWISYYTPPCNYHIDTIHVFFPRIHLSVSPGDTTIKYGDSIMLQATGAEKYLWRPPSGLDHNTSATPWAKPSRSVGYTVYGFNQYGCQDSASIRIDIDYTIPYLIPNAFSPNGDGFNDVFKVEGLPLQLLADFKVFNRWGQCVFQASGPKEGWDGRINGGPAEVGTYYYMIQLAYPDGTTKICKGDVLLVR